MGIYADIGRRSVWRVRSSRITCFNGFNLSSHASRVKLAIHRDTAECVAVKIVEVDPNGALTPECLKKEVCSNLRLILGLRHLDLCGTVLEYVCSTLTTWCNVSLHTFIYRRTFHL